MKHHQYSRGWRECNGMTPGAFIRELASIALCYVAVIGFITIVVHYLAR